MSSGKTSAVTGTRRAPPETTISAESTTNGTTNVTSAVTAPICQSWTVGFGEIGSPRRNCGNGVSPRTLSIASFVAYLAGPDSDYMTGQAPMIDGGMVYR